MLLYVLVKLLRYLLMFLLVGTCIAARVDSRWYSVLLMLILMILLLKWLEDRLWLRENEKKPVTCVEATLIRHREEHYGARISRIRYYLTFHQEDGGGDVEFEVPREEFERIQMGAKGPLEYRDWKYLSFRGTKSVR